MASTVEMEHVLVVPTSRFQQVGYFQGFSPDVDRYMEELLQEVHISYRPRAAMELDPSFKQLIPYVLFEYRDPQGESQLFQYVRGKGQGEQRLHSKRSLGVGGHISTTDVASSTQLTYQEGMRRELAEEVRIATAYRETCVGLINDDQTEVGRVHLGVVHLLQVETPDVFSNETDLLEAGFRPVRQLWQERDTMETWSRICLEALFAQ
jgi:predicted NUDIX family phosphoesterase